jgi:hypothetical protein
MTLGLYICFNRPNPASNGVLSLILPCINHRLTLHKIFIISTVYHCQIAMDAFTCNRGSFESPSYLNASIPLRDLFYIVIHIHPSPCSTPCPCLHLTANDQSSGTSRKVEITCSSLCGNRQTVIDDHCTN